MDRTPMEATMTAAEHIVEGSHAAFAGVCFDENNPYSPRHAKVFLTAAMEDIKQKDRLAAIGVDRSLPGRGRVKEEADGVWDVVQLRGTDETPFNEFPHFTLAIRPEEILAVLILSNPYSPRHAKVFLTAAMEDIKQKDRLAAIGVDRSLPGRGRVKEEADGVWDVVQLRGTDETPFNEFPHFTLAIRPEEILAVLILSNKWLASTGTQKQLKDLGFDGFRSAVADVTRTIAAAVGSAKTARPWILVQQRRATRGQQLDVRDGRLEFDPQTAVGLQTQSGDQNELKPQPQWLRATYSALANKSSNLEMCIGARFLYGDPSVQSPGFTDRVVESWAACAPLLSAVLPEFATGVL